MLWRHPGATVWLSLPPHAGGSSHLPIPPPLLFPADICRRQAAHSPPPVPGNIPMGTGSVLTRFGVRTEHKILEILKETSKILCFFGFFFQRILNIFSHPLFTFIYHLSMLAFAEAMI